MKEKQYAFPVAYPVDGNWTKEPPDSFKGLTKREYFAAMAMQGFISEGGYQNAQVIASLSVQAADALIKEIEKKSS